MKNFDFPYINDSPLEDNWREGAPRNCEECGEYVTGDYHECEPDYGRINDAGEEAADSPMTKESWED